MRYITCDRCGYTHERDAKDPNACLQCTLAINFPPRTDRWIDLCASCRDEIKRIMETRLPECAK